MYCDPNFKTKKALKEAVAAGREVSVFQPGLGSVPTGKAQCSVEGPHFPEPHRFYARVEIQDGVITKVLS